MYPPVQNQNPSWPWGRPGQCYYVCILLLLHLGPTRCSCFCCLSCVHAYVVTYASIFSLTSMCQCLWGWQGVCFSERWRGALHIICASACCCWDWIHVWRYLGRQFCTCGPRCGVQMRVRKHLTHNRCLCRQSGGATERWEERLVCVQN